MIRKIKKHSFLFTELVKRDFKKKYKRTILGVFWSVLSPLLNLLVMSLVFTQFFGRSTPHYTIYLFAGNLVFSYYRESTNSGMQSLVTNASIFKKINVPKYMFLLSKNASSLINFSLTLVVFFIFVAGDGIAFTWKFLLLLYPIACMVLFNMGVGLVLSALYVFFKDIQYLYEVFTTLLMYCSAIFYTIDGYSPAVQMIFHINPVYVYINYFRQIIIYGAIPSPLYHLLMAFDAALVLGLGFFIYKKYNHQFLYYV